ncbi:MAG TPA: VWA domain-containing protein [Actinophytocola sp.]|uniref:VWA domain-containing protein n=1 Tax=Actinophytocola sp. TaxID=1872138 RepID=UPI002DDD2A16|nr:VWA domain-containing protein [Actinophytocola sp.]HEV2783971.1 VWA domain-containing protein [Actinophytocola sp.]
MRANRPLIVLPLLALVGASSVFPTPATAVEAPLPGGTRIAVTMNTPADNAILPPGPVTITGRAEIGGGQPVPNTTLTYVVDVSGSTQDEVQGCSGDENNDGATAPDGRPINDILDCELAAAKALNGEAVRAQTVAKVSVAVFGKGAATADLNEADGDLPTTHPRADDNGNGVPDVVEVLSSVHNRAGENRPDPPGGVEEFTRKSAGNDFTNFEAGITAALSAATATRAPSRIVIFMSDGANNFGGDIDDLLIKAKAEGIVFHTFAIGSLAQCGSTTEGNTLAKIADKTGGSCAPVDTIADLPKVVPGIIASRLTELSVQVDGGNPVRITNVTPPLPVVGPATVDYSVATTPLQAGPHRLCVTAKGSDGGGPGEVTDCRSVTIKAAPAVSAGGPYTGEEDHPVSIAGTVTEPNSPGLTTTWAVTPVPGAACSFGDSTALSTVVTCTEPGTYQLTLTVDDKVNPPVVVRTTMTLSRTPGALSLRTTVEPAVGFVGGDPVVVTHSVRNAGPAAMPAVRLTSTLPATLRASAVSPAGCAGVCDLGTLAPGQTVLVRLTFTPVDAVDQPVSATVSTSGPDIDPADNAGAGRVVIRRPVLAVDPPAGPQGFVTHVVGKDFPAGARIRLKWSIGISEIPGEATVGPDGTIDAQALVFHKDIKGERRLLAEPVAGPRFGAVESNPFLVVARTLKPQEFIIR